MIFQKIVCMAALIAAVLVFVGSLGFATDLYDGMSKAVDYPGTEWEYEKVPGAMIYYETFEFNSAFTVVSIVLLILTLLLFITNTHQDVLDKYEGREIIFGFRPECVHPVIGERVKSGYRVKCFVNLVELLGDNTNVYVNFDGFNSILKVDPHNSPSVGSSFEFAIPYESVYLFDKETEKRIKTKSFE